MCPEHEMEKVNMYCEVCRRPVCHLCKLGGSHANHKVTSMSSAYKILKVPVGFPLRLCRVMCYLMTKLTNLNGHIVTRIKQSLNTMQKLFYVLKVIMVKQSSCEPWIY